MTRTTPLHDWHVAHGANMGEFAGYEMPVWYPAGVRAEHLAVLERAGIFDTSHMAVLGIRGEGAFDLLQLCHTKDLALLFERGRHPGDAGRCAYGVALAEDGVVVDDAIVCQIAPETYLWVANAGMGPRVAAHLSEHRGRGRVEIVDLTDRVGKLDVQGPASGNLLRKALRDADRVFSDMHYFTFKGHFDRDAPQSGVVRTKDGTPILLSRTGYTGEFGFELFVDRAHETRLWEALLEAGAELDVIPCGLAARDSLRAGAGLPLSGQDIGPWPFLHTPWAFALPFDSDGGGFTKDFVGRKALEELANPEYTYTFVGFDLRKVDAYGSRAVVIDSEGVEIGVVTTCVSEMGIGRAEGRIYSVVSPDKPEGFVPRGLCCGFVRVRTRVPLGQELRLRDAKREIRVQVVADVRPDRTARRPIQSMLS